MDISECHQKEEVISLDAQNMYYHKFLLRRIFFQTGNRDKSN